jgi:hypothetical protein
MIWKDKDNASRVQYKMKTGFSLPSRRPVKDISG